MKLKKTQTNGKVFCIHGLVKHSLYIHIPHSNLQIQCNPYQNSQWHISQN